MPWLLRAGRDVLQVEARARALASAAADTFLLWMAGPAAAGGTYRSPLWPAIAAGGSWIESISRFMGGSRERGIVPGGS